MKQKLSWNEIQRIYPDEWIALTDYNKENDSGIEIRGRVIAHSKDQNKFNTLCKELVQRYKKVARRYTGTLIQKPQELIRWKLSNIKA